MSFRWACFFGLHKWEWRQIFTGTYAYHVVRVCSSCGQLHRKSK